MFHVVELWLENACLIELLAPAFATEYQRSMTTERWQRQLGVCTRVPSYCLAAVPGVS